MENGLSDTAELKGFRAEATRLLEVDKKR